MTGKRVLFTGGSGKAGQYVVGYLLEQGHRVLNVDLKPLDLPGVDNLTVDITDSGQVFNAMSAYAGMDELERGTGVPSFDAVVHFAAVPAILLAPDNETFRVNTMGTYNVIEAAVKLGIPKVVIASSETTYGICFSDGRVDPHSLPLEEDYDVDPMDSYGLSKVVNERTARSFQRRSGSDIYALRIGNVIEPHEYESTFPEFFANPEMRRRNAFCYIDARNLGQIVDRCLAIDGLGFQVFNAGNDTNSANIPHENWPSGSSPVSRSPVSSGRTRRCSPTARSATSWASSRTTTGAATCPAEPPTGLFSVLWWERVHVVETGLHPTGQILLLNEVRRIDSQPPGHGPAPHLHELGIGGRHQGM